MKKFNFLLLSLLMLFSLTSCKNNESSANENSETSTITQEGSFVGGSGNESIFYTIVDDPRLFYPAYSSSNSMNTRFDYFEKKFEENETELYYLFFNIVDFNEYYLGTLYYRTDDYLKAISDSTNPYDGYYYMESGSSNLKISDCVGMRTNEFGVDNFYIKEDIEQCGSIEKIEKEYLTYTSAFYIRDGKNYSYPFTTITIKYKEKLLASITLKYIFNEGFDYSKIKNDPLNEISYNEKDGENGFFECLIQYAQVKQSKKVSN